MDRDKRLKVEVWKLASPCRRSLDDGTHGRHCARPTAMGGSGKLSNLQTLTRGHSKVSGGETHLLLPSGHHCGHVGHDPIHTAELFQARTSRNFRERRAQKYSKATLQVNFGRLQLYTMRGTAKASVFVLRDDVCYRCDCRIIMF